MLYLVFSSAVKFSGNYCQGILGKFVAVRTNFKLQDGSHGEDIFNGLRRMASHYEDAQTGKGMVISVLWKGSGSSLSGEVQLLDQTSFLKDVSTFFGRDNVHVNVKLDELSFKIFNLRSSRNETTTLQGDITTRDMKITDNPEKTCEDTSIMFPSKEWLEKFRNDQKATCHLSVTVTIDNPATRQVGKREPKIDQMAVFEKMLHDEIYSDAVIIAREGNPQKCHRSVLSASSTVLETMFQTEMVEGKTHRVEMTDMSEEGVKAFLAYIYYLSVESPSEDSRIAFELLNAGHKYNVVPHLEEAMKKLILSKPDDWLDVEIAVKIFCLARNLPSCEDLKLKCVEVMQKKLNELSECKSYNELFMKNPLAAKELCQLAFSQNRKV